MNSFDLEYMILLLQQAYNEEEKRQFNLNVVQKCKESSKATDEDVNAVKMHETPKTQTAKCTNYELM